MTGFVRTAIVTIGAGVALVASVEPVEAQLDHQRVPRARSQRRERRVHRDLQQQRRRPHGRRPRRARATASRPPTASRAASIPNGTVIPNRGHYLCVNCVGYSLASLSGRQRHDRHRRRDLHDRHPRQRRHRALQQQHRRRQLHRWRTGSTPSARRREANTLYKEGTGYPALTPFSIDYSFYRDDCGKGGSITTLGACPISDARRTPNNNAADFIFVDTNGTSAGAGQRLGAPGPENLSSPIQRNAVVRASTCSTRASASAPPPNRVRDFTSAIPRTTRRSARSTSAARSPTTPAATSRGCASGSSTSRRSRRRRASPTCGRGRRRRRRRPSIAPPCGIGHVATSPCRARRSSSRRRSRTAAASTASMSAGTVTLGTPLANGAGIDVRFLLGIQQTGSFKFYLNVEALP